MICPNCHSLYPAGHTHCDNDGHALTNDDERAWGEKRSAQSAIEAGSSLDISFSDASIGGQSLSTKAERPSGKQRLDQSSSASQKTQNTIYDNGTRVSVGTPPAMPEDSKPKPKRKRDEARAAAEMRCGEVLGSYRLQSVLGIGGMGAVYTAEHIRLGRKVALKLLHPQYAARHEAVVRFFQEAQAVNRIRHKNIVDVTDLVEHPDGSAFIIMELLSGESLGARLRRVGLLGTGPTISVMIQICDGLKVAHGQGIVHRDLKPDNIFLTKTDDGELLVKLLDFGVAKLVGGDSEVGVKTAAGSVVGTPTFMSPEQAGGLEIDHRSDIYSLGAIMYQLFTGQHAFRGKSFGDYVRMHLNDEPVPARQTHGGVSMDVELERIIMRCLSKSPNARFQSAAELRAALVDYFGIFASRVGGIVEGDSGIYRLSGLRDRSGQSPVFSSPPSTLDSSMPRGGPIDASAPETALMVGDLPGARAGAGRKPLIWIAGAAVVAVAAILAVSLNRGGGGGDGGVATVVPDASVSQATVTPLRATPDATVKPEIIPIRIESNVLARVFKGDETVARCGTPCQLRIDPIDGDGSLRSFVVRADGYGEGYIEVDTDEPREVYSIDLEPLLAIEDGSKTGGSKTGGSKTGGSKTGGSKTGGSKTGGSKTGGSKTGGSKTGDDGAVPADKTLNPFKKKKRSR